MNFIDIPEEYCVHQNIPLEKFSSMEIAENVESIIMTGSIKAAISGIKQSLSETVRYEEILLFHCQMYDRSKIYDVGRMIYKDIKYPCIIEFQIDDATTIGVCEFTAGKTDRDNNVLRTLHFSHWLHQDILSPQAKEMLAAVNTALRKKTDMADIYKDVRHAILYWKMGGTSKAHVDRIIYALIGKGKISPDRIRQYCQPFEYHAVVPGANKYGKNKRGANYTLIHDYEEIWYCLMKCPETKRVIEYRRYRNIDELFYAVDSREW